MTTDDARTEHAAQALRTVLPTSDDPAHDQWLALYAAVTVTRALDDYDGNQRERFATAIERQLLNPHLEAKDDTFNSGRDAGLRLAARLVRERP